VWIRKFLDNMFFFSDSRIYVLCPAKYFFIHSYPVSSLDQGVSISKVSVTVVCNLKQTMNHVQCFIKSAIF